MSNIIINKLKQIEKTSRVDKSYSDPSIGYLKSEETMGCSHQPIDRELSREQTVSTTLRHSSSGYEEGYYMARIWASKLKKLELDQRLYAEKAIRRVLYEAQLGNLHMTSVKINGTNDCSIVTVTPSATTPYSISTSKLSANSNSELKHNISTIDHSPVLQSSEIILSESFPSDNEYNDIVQPVPQIDEIGSKLSVMSSDEFNNHGSMFVSTQVSLSTLSDQTSPSTFNAATNTPTCLMAQLTKYIRDCYDSLKKKDSLRP